MMQETMNSEPNKFPVASAPQKAYYFLLLCFMNDFIVIDNVRRFTGYSGCKDLERYIQYAKQLRSKSAVPHA